MELDFNSKVLAELARIGSAEKVVGGSIKSPSNPLFAKACVRANYQVADLMTSDDFKPDAIEELLAASRRVQTKRSSPRWELEEGVRREWLKLMAENGSLATEASQLSVDSKDTLQRMFSSYISEKAPPLEQQTLEELAATARVESWLRDIVKELPTAFEIDAAREIRELLSPFENLTSSFRGRKNELDQLSDYVEWLPSTNIGRTLLRHVRRIFSLRDKPPLMISGLGGAGKTTLVAKFIMDHWSSTRGRERIPFVYLDFDRPSVSLGEPLTLLIEAARQLALQYPKAAPEFNRLVESWRFELVHASKDKSMRREPERTYASRRGDKRLFSEQFASVWWTAIGDEDRPLLMVFDSFEEVQGRIAELSSVFELLEEWTSQIHRLRVVIAGRAEIKAFPTEHLLLGDFDEESAAGFLSSQGIADPLARELFQRVGGNPLTLRLAASAVKRFDDKLEDFRTRSWFFLKLDTERVQQELFRRNLSHIKNPEVRKLAFPGLVIRRISPELIQQVLAGPCKLGKLSDADAKLLFSELQKEVFLISEDIDGQIRFRPDLRRLLLRLILTEEPELSKRIHNGAVDYYQRRTDPASRAEVVYHRLARGDEVESLADLLEPDLESYLTGSLYELPTHAHIFLANRYGLPVPDEISKEASLLEWEKATANLIRRAFESGSVAALKECLAQLEQRRDRGPSHELTPLEAELLERLDRVDEALAAADIAIDLARQSRDPKTEYEMLFLSVWMLERSGQWSKARRMLKRAFKIARENGMFEQMVETALELYVSAQRIRPYPYRRAKRIRVLVESLFKRWPGGPSMLPESLGALRPELRTKVDEVLKRFSLTDNTIAESDDRWLSEDDLQAAQNKLVLQSKDLTDFERLVYLRLGVSMRAFSELTGTVQLAAFEAIRYAEWRNCLSKLLNPAEAVEKTERSENITTAAANQPRAWILIAGLGKRSGLPPDVIFASGAVGKMLAREGYGLITGGWPGVDYLTAASFAEALGKFGRRPEDFLCQIVPLNANADFKGGRVISIADDVQAAIEKADAVVLISGAGGTRIISDRAMAKGLPVFPIPGTGGDARRIFDNICKAWGKHPAYGPDSYQRLSLSDFQSLESPVDMSIHTLSKLLSAIESLSKPQTENPPLMA